jgi:hypothetical protein
MYAPLREHSRQHGARAQERPQQANCDALE